jgi:hypothetical protein
VCRSRHTVKPSCGGVALLGRQRRVLLRWALPRTHSLHDGVVRCRHNDANDPLFMLRTPTAPHPSLMPTVNGNTVRSFPTDGQLSAARGSSTTVSTL